MSDTKAPIKPEPEHFEIAHRKMAQTGWVALPHGLLDANREMRELSDGAVRAVLRLIDAQWSHGSIPSDPKVAARLVGLPLPTVREAMALFTSTINGDLVHPGLAAERQLSLDRIALSVAKGQRGAGIRWADDSPANSPANGPANGRGNGTLPNHVVVGGAEPPEGRAARGQAVKAEARAGVSAGLVVTPLAFGAKMPTRGKRQQWVTTLEEVDAEWPAVANLGYQPGQSGFIEVDVDDLKSEALAQTLGCYAERTFEVQTPRALAPEGHRKKFARAVRLRFQKPAGLEFGKVKLLNVLEIFGDTGHVLLPPSWISEYNAGYRVLDDSPALPCPSRLAEALRQPSAPHPRSPKPSGIRNGVVLLAALEKRIGKRLPRNRKQFTTTCPSHDDRAASLSVGVGNDGAPTFCCQAGCTAGEVLAALGLSWADLYNRKVG